MGKIRSLVAGGAVVIVVCFVFMMLSDLWQRTGERSGQSFADARNEISPASARASVPTIEDPTDVSSFNPKSRFQTVFGSETPLDVLAGVDEGDRENIRVLWKWYIGNMSDPVAQEALLALMHHKPVEIIDDILGAYPKMSSDQKTVVLGGLAAMLNMNDEPEVATNGGGALVLRRKVSTFLANQATTRSDVRLFAYDALLGAPNMVSDPEEENARWRAYSSYVTLSPDERRTMFEPDEGDVPFEDAWISAAVRYLFALNDRQADGLQMLLAISDRNQHDRELVNEQLTQVMRDDLRRLRGDGESSTPREMQLTKKSKSALTNVGLSIQRTEMDKMGNKPHRMIMVPE